MIIPIICIILSIIIAYYLWCKTTDIKYKFALVIGVIIIFAISSQYIKLTKTAFLEGFEVQIPELDNMESTSSSNTKVLKSPEYKGSGNAYLDTDEESFLSNGGSKSSSNHKIKTIGELDALAKSGAKVNLPSTRTVVPGQEKFNNIVQKDTGGEQSSIFNPQIVFLNGGGSGSSSTSGGNTTTNLDYNALNQQSLINQQASSQSSTVNNFGVPPRVLDEYLKPRADIFGGGNGNPESNPFSWIKEYLDGQNSRSGNANGSTAICPVSKPYADESRGRFNSATLTNRTYVPGMSYMPPAEWNMPQTHDTKCRQVCNNNFIDTRALPIGIMDHGTPVFALEIGDDGTIAKTEDDVRYTNVGSIMPKFEYREYVDCPSSLETPMPSSTQPFTTMPSTTRATTSTMPFTTMPSTTRATTSTQPFTTMPSTTRATTTTQPFTTTSTMPITTTSTMPITTTSTMPITTTTTMPITTTSTMPITTTTTIA